MITQHCHFPVLVPPLISCHSQTGTMTDSTKEEVPVRDSLVWTSGDFALVSSDGERFLIDSTTLCWAR